MKQKKYRASNYILIVVGVIFLLTGILIYPSFKLLVTGTRAVGVVNNVYRNSDAYSIKAKYNCGSKMGILGDSSMSSSSYNYRVGDQIEIYCDEKNPEIFVPKEFSNYLLILFPLMGFFALFFGIKREILRQELIKTGMKVEATIISMTPFWRNQINKQDWYKIVARYGNDIFVNKDAFDNTKKIVKEGDKIDVYLDTGDHSKYWMDIDSIFEKLNDNNSINNQ